MGDIKIRQALDEYEKIYMASRNFAQRTRVEYLNDLKDLISRKQIPHLRIGRNVRVRESDLMKWLEERAENAN
jgi:excisionase family DNA binding protein